MTLAFVWQPGSRLARNDDLWHTGRGSPSVRPLRGQEGADGRLDVLKRRDEGWVDVERAKAGERVEARGAVKGGGALEQQRELEARGERVVRARLPRARADLEREGVERARDEGGDARRGRDGEEEVQAGGPAAEEARPPAVRGGVQLRGRGGRRDGTSYECPPPPAPDAAAPAGQG